MTFLLRIFFAGLIAFVPSRDGKELTVLLVDARQSSMAADGSPIPSHHPILLASARQCSGHCVTRDPEIARLFFPRDSANASRFLAAALDQGAAWQLDGSDLSIVDDSRPRAYIPPLEIHHAVPRAAAAKRLPENPAEHTDFDWIAGLGQILPAAGNADPDVLACQPKKGLIVARLRLRSGKIWAYHLVEKDKQVPVFRFKKLRGDGAEVAHSQALADWVAAEVEVSGDSVEIVERHFGGQGMRTIRLEPQDKLVEIALMNVPDPPPPGPVDEPLQAHTTDTHFERYYDLSRQPPAWDQRPVPQAMLEQSTPARPPEPPSRLLTGLGLDTAKGFYERILCAMAQLSASDSP